MIENSEIKGVYSEIQKQLFYLIPEKWDKIYLYASVSEEMMGPGTGELFFYYFPKGLLKKNPVNVYEIPNKFNLNEDEYIKLVEILYQEIKELRIIFKKYNHRLWSSVTIKIEGLKFQIEYSYEDLSKSKYSNTDRHIAWLYNNLNLPMEAFSKKEREIIKSYINDTIYFRPDIEIYTESIYKNPIKKILAYNKEQKEPEYVQETEMQQKERQAKNRFEEQKYTYKIKGKKSLRTLKEEEKNTKPKTYVEQIEEQRNRVRSQILQNKKL